MHDMKMWMEAARGELIPVIDTMPADLHTPLSVYLRLAASSKNSFLLESVEGGESLGRYSFIGSDPAMILAGDANSASATVSLPVEARPDPPVERSMFDVLRSHFSTCGVTRDRDLPPFLGGAIGYLGFNCSGWFEKTVARSASREDPDAEFMFFRTVVAFDHAKQIISIISLWALDGGERDEQEAKNRNAEIRRKLETSSIPLPRAVASNTAGGVTSNWSKEEFESAVREIKELIRAGECYQVVISQRFSRPTSADPVSIYRSMRSLNPSPYMFLLEMPDRSIIGASPEMLVKCVGRDLEYRPIAGTRPRGSTTEEDASLASEMRSDQKEVAEHLMLVDLGRNDLGRVAEYGTVKVDDLMAVEKYSHVQHLVSRLSAKLRDGLDRFDALAACFPAGTVSGAPKVRALEIIKELEPDDRGVYAGAVGYFDYGGNMDTCIAIRTMVLKDGIAHVQAGAGIVADSVPELEYQETINKARALLKAIELAEAKAW
jgi:anthranilate synthase component 1